MTLKEFLSAITILRYITVPKTITNCFTLIFVYKACTSYFHFQKIFQLSSISLFQVYMFLTFICVRVFNVSEITSYQIEKERISFPFTIIISPIIIINTPEIIFDVSNPLRVHLPKMVSYRIEKSDSSNQSRDHGH